MKLLNIELNKNIYSVKLITLFNREYKVTPHNLYKELFKFDTNKLTKYNIDKCHKNFNLISLTNIISDMILKRIYRILKIDYQFQNIS